MFNTSNLYLCTTKLNRMKKSVALLMRCKSISTGAEYLTPDSEIDTVKLIVRKRKFAGLAQEIGFSAPKSCRLL